MIYRLFPRAAIAGCVILGLSLSACVSAQKSAFMNSIAPKSKILEMSEQAWQERLSISAKSENVQHKARVQQVFQQLLAASDFGEDAWDVQIFAGGNNDFSLPGNKIALSDRFLDRLQSDDKLAFYLAVAMENSKSDMVQRRMARLAVGNIAASIGGGEDKHRMLSEYSVMRTTTPEEYIAVDMKALQLMQAAGYSVAQADTYLVKPVSNGFSFNQLPVYEARLAAIKEFIGGAQ